MTTSTKAKKILLASTALAVGVGASFVAAGPASAHAWTIGDLTARAAITANNAGPIHYEPQSLEAPGGFPAAGPVDGKIASANEARGPQLDEQTEARWIKNEIAPGPVAIGWRTSAGTIGSAGDHATDYIDYYITKVGWDPNDKLERSDFVLLEHKEYNGETVMSIGEHTISIPDTHQGYHVILGVWEINDTTSAFYNVMDVNISGDAPPADAEAPTTPGDLEALPATTNSVDLSWGEATDNVGVAGYEILRDGEKISSTSGTSFSDTGLSPDTEYTYEVRAFDAAGNMSEHTAPLTITTQALPEGPDTEAPTRPTSLHAMGITTNSAALMWNAASDNIGVTEYKIWDAALGEYVATVTDTNAVIDGLAPNTMYTFTVQAFDAAGNYSASSNILTIFTKSDDGSPAHPAWDPRGAYTKGDLVMHDGDTYEAVQTYQGHGDLNWITALSLWNKK